MKQIENQKSTQAKNIQYRKLVSVRSGVGKTG